MLSQSRILWVREMGEILVVVLQDSVVVEETSDHVQGGLTSGEWS